MHRLCAKLGLKGARISKQSRHVPYSHPSMQEIREWISMATSSQKVDARLMCHFDQVWSVHFEPARRVLWKSAEAGNEMVDPNHKKPSQKAMLEKIREALSNSVKDTTVEKKKNYEVKQAALGPQSTLVPVDNSRIAKTVTTLSWADGSMGRAYVTAPSTTISDSVAEEMNQQLRGTVFIARGHESRTHMWNGDTLQQYLIFLKEEFRRKRLALNLPHSVRGLVLCDAATVHSAHMYDQIRSRFELEANCIFVHGGSSSLKNHGIQIVGGWGACGAPNDAWHEWYHYLRRGWMRLATGMGASLKLRNGYEAMGLSIDGNARFTWLGCNCSDVLPFNAPSCLVHCAWLTFCLCACVV